MAFPLLGAMFVLTAAQTAYGILGDRKSAKAARKLGEFEGAMYDEAAEDALLRGKEEGFRLGASARRLTGSQTASLAASGVDVGSGSAADVIASDRRLAEMDILAVENNAIKEAHGLKQQGQFARMGGKNAAAGYRNRATETLLSGALDLFQSYQKFGLNKGKPKGSTDINRYAQ